MSQYTDPMNATHSASPMGRSVASRDDRTLAVVAHVSTIAAMVLSAGWLSFVGPLVVWLLFRDRSELVRRSAAGSFNFNVSLWLATVAAYVLAFTVIGLPVAIVIWIAVAVLTVVCHVLGAVKASKGEVYRYPFSLSLLQ